MRQDVLKTVNRVVVAVDVKAVVSNSVRQDAVTESVPPDAIRNVHPAADLEHAVVVQEAALEIML